ncbi:MAG: hypothetical protein LBO06_00745 [Bacteroidales bacterium]|jgi:tetratricopeptide (TPR) repeat protein|nr:hypothetical protein [Bacteroidales bacterium]
MKKAILFIALAAMTMGSYAQTMKVQSAFADFNGSRYAKAKQNIDEACQDEKTKTEAKTWFYAGLIYSKLLQLGTSDDAKDIKTFQKQKVSEPIDTIAARAKDALMKSVEMEKAAGTQEYIQSTMGNLDFISQYYTNQCVSLFNSQKFTEAISVSEEVVKMYNLSKSDNAKIFALKAKFILASSYFYTKENEKASNMYRELVKDKSSETDVYINLYAENLAAKDTTKAINVLKAGIKNIPDTLEGNFLVKSVLAGLYLRMDNAEEGNKLIDELTAKTGDDPKNLNTLAQELSTAGGEAKAIELYNKSLQLNPNQIGANYGLGLLHYNKAADYVNMGNTLADKGNYDEASKYDAMAKEEFQAAIPNFKSVLKIDEKNFYTLKALITTYRKLNMLTEANELDAVFQTLIKK